jgi:hypothetical protein
MNASENVKKGRRAEGKKGRHESGSWGLLHGLTSKQRGFETGKKSMMGLRQTEGINWGRIGILESSIT